MLYAHLALLFIANWTTTMNMPFMIMVLAPGAILLAVNIFNVLKGRRWSNVVGSACGLVLGLLQCGYAYLAYPHYGEAAIAAAFIMAFTPWMYALTNLFAAIVLFFRK